MYLSYWRATVSASASDLLLCVLPLPSGCARCQSPQYDENEGFRRDAVLLVASAVAVDVASAVGVVVVVASAVAVTATIVMAVDLQSISSLELQTDESLLTMVDCDSVEVSFHIHLS